MKRFLALILVMIMLISLVGCKNNLAEESAPAEESNPGVVTILAHSETKTFMEKFKAYVLHEYPDIELEFEYLSTDSLSDALEYETQVQRLRAEIMAGKGPDIFLLPTGDIVSSSEDGSEEAYFEPLFADINEAMYNRVLLPVDEYLKDAKHYRPENYPAAVMEAGRSDEGQCVFPLQYSYNLLLLDKTQMADPEFEYTCIEDILSSDDKNMVDAFTAKGQNMASAYIADIADYSEGELLVTEDDIRFMLEFATMNTGFGGEMELLHPLYGFPFIEMSPPLIQVYENYKDIAYPMYMPNKEGGITAKITSFAAINANTDAPEDAFKVLDLLYSDVIQLEKPYNEYGDYIQDFNVFAASGADGMSVDINTVSRESTRKMLRELGSKITAVRFDSGLDTVLDGYIRNSLEMKFDNTSKDYTEECMKDLRMVLNE